VQDKKKMLHKNYQIIIHKIVHKDVRHVALFVKKKRNDINIKDREKQVGCWMGNPRDWVVGRATHKVGSPPSATSSA